jgi:hypothetical protein
VSKRNDELSLVLTGSPGQVEHWIQVEGLVIQGPPTAFADLQSFQAANGLVTSVDPLLHRYAELATAVMKEDVGNLVAALLHAELPGVVASPWFGLSGSFSIDVCLGVTARFRAWVGEAAAANHTTTLQVKPLVSDRLHDWQPLPGKAVSYVAAASVDQFANEQGEEGYRNKLDRIQSLFGLSSSELSQMLDVSREGLRKWQMGYSIAPRRSSEIDDLHSLATWFANHLRPEALPAFVRRSVPALNGQSPYDYLRAHRWTDLRRIYEKGFSVEVTS